jgi:7-keto-8-aminopelargonate synthetase-like enzyme
MPPTDPLAWIDTELVRLEQAGLRRRLALRAGPQAARVVVNGKELANFGSNDYLGLAADARLRAAARAAIERDGWGSGASPLVSGRGEAQADLERRLAEFEGTEAAIVFPSGFAANAGIIPALVEEGDAIFGDAKNHASLIDGCRLSKAQRFAYPHADCDALEAMLREAGRFRRRLIVTDTLFSMDGDVAPLVRLAELAERYDAMLMVDEAHATGVFGEHGRGIVEHLGSVPFFDPSASVLDRRLTKKGTDPVETGGEDVPARQASLHDRVHIRVGTLSKALGSAGGFVCGRRSLIDWLANRARTYVFSTAQPSAVYAAAAAALDIVRTEPHRGKDLLERSADLRSRLSAQGWQLGARSEERGARNHPEGTRRGAESESQNIGDLQDRVPSASTSDSLLLAPRSPLLSTQIIPLVIGDADRTMRSAEELRQAGFFVPGIRPPSVPEGQSLLRISLCYHHKPEMIDALVEAFGPLRTLGK